MSKLFFFICLIFCVLTGCSHETIVFLQFKNTDGGKILVLRPVNHNLLGITDTIKSVKEDSVYRFVLSIDRMAPMRVLANRQSLDFVVLPNESLHVVCDMKAWDSCRFEGENASGELLYSKLMDGWDIYKYEWIKWPVKFPLDTIPENVVRNFRKLQENEIGQFDSLYRLNEISLDFLEYVRKDIQLYYSTTLSKICRGLADKVQGDAFGLYWARLYQEYPLLEEELNSQWFTNYANLYLEFYLPYKETVQPDIASEKKDGFHLPYVRASLPDIATEEEYYEHFYTFYNQQITNPHVLEMVLGTKLFLKGLNNKTCSAGILPCFDKFNQQFPGNPYAEHFIPFIKQVKDFQERIQEDFSSKVRFVERYQQLDSWEALMKHFKGKPVFIDFWFSTCGPCREEFAYIKPLKEFLKVHQIEMLYISVDGDEREKNWKNSIKYFDLTGWQVRASRALWNDIGKKFGIYSFPTYMLVDEEGEVLLRDAKCPSEKEKLYQQITEALK